MALILSIETSGQVCSAALHVDGVLKAAREITIPQSHASRLAPAVQEVMEEAGITPANLDAVAVSSGPGSYTGLRIGTSTAKGLCYASDIPLIAVGSLEILAYQARPLSSGSWLCPMLDARRMEVYSMLLDDHDAMVQPVAPVILDHTSFHTILDQHPITFVGEGARKFAPVVNHVNARFLSDCYPDAVTLGYLAYRKFKADQFEDLVHFEPVYLKEFVAKPSRSLLAD